jgi:hypothetical protein
MCIESVQARTHPQLPVKRDKGNVYVRDASATCRVWRVVHDKKTLTGTKPTETGSGYSVTDVILSDNALETPISGSTSRELTPEALDTNITTEYHTNCSRLTRHCSCPEITTPPLNQIGDSPQ